MIQPATAAALARSFDDASDGAPRLIGMDVHGIPPKRKEPYHLHHDMLFLFRAVSEETQVSEESRDVLWCAPADFARYALPDNFLRARRRALT